MESILEEGPKFFCDTYLKRLLPTPTPLSLPASIVDDLVDIVDSIEKQQSPSKILFRGPSGTGKTAAAREISVSLNKPIYMVNPRFHLFGESTESAKKVSEIFDEINNTLDDTSILLFKDISYLGAPIDENQSTPKEPGIVQTAFIEGLRSLDKKMLFIATSAGYKDLDLLLMPEFETTVSFDRYSREDLLAAAYEASNRVFKVMNCKENPELLHKILNNLETIPFPGELIEISYFGVKETKDLGEYKYLKSIFNDLYGYPKGAKLQKLLTSHGYTPSEIKILT